jgi:hypothetical protein
MASNFRYVVAVMNEANRPTANTMKQFLFILVLSLIFSAHHLSAQTLRWFHVDEQAQQSIGFRYYHQVNLADDKISYSYMTESRYSTGFYGYGDVATKYYDTDENFLDETSCTGDSLYVRKILQLSNGERLVLSTGFSHYALYDLDTLVALNEWGEPRSYIHHLDANNETIALSTFDDVHDMVINDDETYLYFVNLYDFNEADLMRMDLSSSNVTSISHMVGMRHFPVLLKTNNHIYVTGATIMMEVEVDEEIIDVQFAYTNVLLQFNNNGELNWVRQLEDVTTSPVGMAEAPMEGLYFSSDLYDGINVGNQSLMGPTWSGDFYVTRIDATGNFLWATEAPNNTLCDFALSPGYHLASDDDYNVYLSGSSRKLLVWDDGTTVGRDLTTDTPTVLKYNSDGQIIGSIVPEDGQSGHFSSMDVNQNGDILLSGWMTDTFTFQGVTKEVTDELVHPYVLYFTNDEVIGVTNLIESTSGFSLYPSVVQIGQSVRLVRTENTRDLVRMYNSAGRLVLEQDITDKECTMNLPQLAAGVYHVKVGTSVQRLLVVK